jgi:YfiH family protein
MQLHETPFLHYSSDLLSVPHGSFCRLGGISDPPFATLNLSYHVGDQPDLVHINRERALAVLGLRRLVSLNQVHGDQILLAEPHHVGIEQEGYDAVISTLPGTGLLIQQADCQAILLSAPEQGVIAAIHCGWRGSVLDIIGKTIECLRTHCGVPPETLYAFISPSLGPCCAEFINAHAELPSWMHEYQVRPHYFDFWAISRHQLMTLGLRTTNIEVAGICTRCDQRFFSYRRAVQGGKGITGRNGSLIGLAG